MTFSFEKAASNEFESIRAFYWDLIDSMRQDGKGDNIGWKKGIYPTDEFLKDSLADGTLFTLKDENELCGCVILNSTANEGYNGIKWSKALADSEILIPHALAVTPHRQGQGIGKCFMAKIFDFARESGKKAMRLDILATNTAAEKLYTSVGFRFVETKKLFYEDTGLTAYKMFELDL